MRTFWHHLEPVHAVTYFSSEASEAAASLGLKGFWMGYFANRTAPLGPVAAGIVEATFYNFHPDRVRRAIPDAWAHASPGAIIDSRAVAAAAALRRLLPDGMAEDLAHHVASVLAAPLAAAPTSGRPLFAANRDLPPHPDPVSALWQAATTFREFRGDGHVALLLGAGLEGCDVHVLLAADERLAPELFLRSRGWSEADWGGATQRLATRGLVTKDGLITEAGHNFRSDIELRTDELSALPAGSVGDEELAKCLDHLAPAVARIVASGSIPFPNPMGLPTPAAASASVPSGDTR